MAAERPPRVAGVSLPLNGTRRKWAEQVRNWGTLGRGMMGMEMRHSALDAVGNFRSGSAYVSMIIRLCNGGPTGSVVVGNQADVMVNIYEALRGPQQSTCLLPPAPNSAIQVKTIIRVTSRSTPACHV